MGTLHEICAELCELFKVAGVEKPEHGRLTIRKNTVLLKGYSVVYHWGDPASMDEADARDLLASHFERLFLGLSGRREVSCLSVWLFVYRAENGSSYSGHHSDKLTAILRAMRGMHASS